jgi:hypothetical protein
MIRFYGMPFRSYTFETALSLNGEWIPLETGIRGTPESIQIPIPPHHLQESSRFFRFRQE